MRRWFYIDRLANCFFCGIVLTIGGLTGICAQDGVESKATQGVVPPALPLIKSPIEYFRELLALPVPQRERSIADRGEEQKKIIRAKIKEYELMTPEERELRLAVTELRWYLVPLMRLDRNERAGRLKMIPPDKRYLVKDRLQRWDKLEPDQQKEFLESEMTVNYFLRLRTSTPEQKTNLLETVSTETRRKLEKDLERWSSLPPEERERMSNRFEDFFELNAFEREKTLSTLSQSERVQMEKTLLSFQNLSVDQRRHCIKSFDKLANMSGHERSQFLQKAEAWEKMSPTDRSAWRELVHKIPRMPPLPPGLKVGPPLPGGTTNLSK